MKDSFALLLLVLVPVIGAAVGAFMPSRGGARWCALLTAVLTLLLAICLAAEMDVLPPFASGVNAASDQLTWGANPATNPFAIDHAGGTDRARRAWFSVHFGVDTISFWLVLLTAFLQPLVVLSSWESIKERATEYYAWMSLLLAAMVGVFVARDLLLFYVFFELTLIPMFFIIGIWGGPERRYAAAKFFLFTFAGSVFTLAAVIYLGISAGTFDIATVIPWAQANLSPLVKFLLFLGLLAGFAVKVPLFPVHTWLPLAHTEAPTAGSVILAGVLLKLGTYGILRVAVPLGLVSVAYGDVIFSFPLFYWFGPVIDVTFGGLIAALGVLCLIGVIYGALVAWVQQDIKKLVAYSSVSHLGFCVLGLLSLTDIGIQGSVLYMINHGLSTGAMFLVIGMIYDRYHTRDINALSGLGRHMPIMSFFFILFVMSSIGLPGTNGFISEYLTIQSAFISPHLGVWFGVFAATGVVLGAIYMLHLAARVIFGPWKVPAGDGHGHGNGDAHGAHTHGTHGGSGQGAGQHHGQKLDLNVREIGLLTPIAIAVIVLGVLPAPVLQSMTPPVAQLRTPANRPATALIDDSADQSLEPVGQALLSASPLGGE